MTDHRTRSSAHPGRSRPTDPGDGAVLPPSDASGGPTTLRTRTGGVWAGVVLSAAVLVFLLVFILQNREVVRIDFLGFSGALPTGVALLFAAIAGLLLVAIPGGVRILQLRRAARRPRG
jgi:uncharacterized integral membrane protein